MDPRMRPIALLLPCLAFAACAGGTRAAPAKAAPGEPLPIGVARVESREIGERIDLTGTLSAWEEAEVPFEVEGRIVELRADLGDRVARGAVLARIAPEEYRLRRAQAEAEREAARTDFDRISELLKQEMAARQQLDEARRRLDVAEAAAGLASKKLADTEVRAPFDGAVSRRLVNPGEYARPGVAAFGLVRPSPLRFRGEVPERFSAGVKSGDRLDVTIAGTGTLSGEVVRVGAAVSTVSRSFPIEARIDNPDGAVKPGTFGRAALTTGRKRTVLVVPEEAVLAFAGTPRVFVVADGVASERVVETGDRFDRLVEIASGLSAGETVATEGARSLRDGQPVRAR